MKLADYGLAASDLTELKRLFEHATTFGSLIQVPEGLAVKLSAIEQLSEVTSQNLFVSETLTRLAQLVQQAELLSAKYDAVVANPPYMGSKGMNALVKKFAKDHFPDAKNDLFACFIERGFSLARDAGYNAMVTMQSWMFLSSFEKMRERMLREKTIKAMAHLGARAFGSISGEVVQTTACVLQNRSPNGYKPVFFRLLDGGEVEKSTALANGEKRFDTTAQDEFKKIPGSPVAYWVSEQVRNCYQAFPALRTFSRGSTGLQTSNSARFLRFWYETDAGRDRWMRFAKGGTFRKWFGNVEHVVNWSNDGADIKSYVANKYPYLNGNYSLVVKNESTYLLEGLVCSRVTSGQIAFRHKSEDEIYSDACTAIFPEQTGFFLALLNSKLLNILTDLNPTLNFQAGDIEKFPVEFRSEILEQTETLASRAMEHTRADWDAYERSWDFQSLPILTGSAEPAPTLESSCTTWVTQNRNIITEMQRLEEENNRLFINAYGLQDELTPKVPIEQITLTVNPAYRYGGKRTEEEQWTYFRQDTMKELVSYAIGCMMGRYSLDDPGLVYAHSGGKSFNACRYTTFPADPDGIVPLTDSDWFEDDAAHRLIEFISVAWDAGSP